MSRPAEEQGARARRARRQERRLRHLRELAHAAAQTEALAQEVGAERLGELEVNPFEMAARRVLREYERGRLTEGDVAALGIKELDGELWIKVARIGHG